MRYFFLLLLIVASIGVFIAFVIPRYDQVKVARADVATYNANLSIANQLQQSRQALIAQYNSISKTDIDNLTTLLPDNVDDIRLIIQLNSLATKDGLSSLNSVNYDPTQLPTTNADGTTTTDTTTVTDPTDPTSALPYGQFIISFNTSGQYSNFLSFISDMEKNLRLVDITGIDFTSTNPDATGTAALAAGLTYKVTLTTYWLKQ